jgi:L-2-amino-thiazoline-4-carboxylic acid hydrolase-like protein
MFLIEYLSWRVYRQWARVALAIARLTPHSRTALGFARIDGRTGSISLRFPFNAPGYLIETVHIDGDIAFDVVRCPVANYFREQRAADLCIASWCNLDYALAELTHEMLVRSKTLVNGDDRCDFRVRDLEQ